MSSKSVFTLAEFHGGADAVFGPDDSVFAEGEGDGDGLVRIEAALSGDGAGGGIVSALEDGIRQNLVVFAVPVAADVVFAVIPVAELDFDVALCPAAAEEFADLFEFQAFAGILFQIIPDELAVLIEDEGGVAVLIVGGIPSCRKRCPACNAGPRAQR